MIRPFRRILVANRGEIALRVIRAAHELGMEAVAVYSDVDRHAAHVRSADLAVRIGPAPAHESYLRAETIVEAAVATGAEAIHPGYGFLAERASFAQAVESAGLAWVGPPPAAIAALGDKLAARRSATAAGVPVVPGTLEPASVDRRGQVTAIVAEAERVGFPLLVKAAAGGGGRGMRRVESAADLPAALVSGSREAASAFGDGSVYIERVIHPARHIEVQLLGDTTGRVVALGERDCSIQRRHQKLIEEAPAPGLTEDQRRALHAMAVRLASASGLQNAATCEFLYEPGGAFYFLEVNTRLQVEHPVTELVGGLDIVIEQFWLAAGKPLSDRALAVAEQAANPTSAAIELRLSAEDPARAFAPTPGRVTRWTMPAGPGVRIDTATAAGDRIPGDYDPLVAKLIVHAADRPAAIARLRRALDELEIGGIQTTVPFHRFAVGHPTFAAADLSTSWVEQHWDGEVERHRAVEAAQLAAGLASLQPLPAAKLAEPGALTAGLSGEMEVTATPGQTGSAAVAARDGRLRRLPGSAWRLAGRVSTNDRWPA
ncbi:MAG TPA: biotin carboxylase N-terminal domain-containing protein [Candidatus Limnocylindrales bacterium]